ncbi:MAG: hypothetical protein M0006_15615 [Magnetospirillum sp.]|nr:hypothetical protein [Magnetospirillum sp.]
MVKTNAEKVAAAEKKRRDRGETKIPVWVPDNPEAKAKVRELAAELCAAALKDKEQGK